MKSYNTKYLFFEYSDMYLCMTIEGVSSEIRAVWGAGSYLLGSKFLGFIILKWDHA